MITLQLKFTEDASGVIVHYSKEAWSPKETPPTHLELIFLDQCDKACNEVVARLSKEGGGTYIPMEKGN